MALLYLGFVYLADYDPQLDSEEDLDTELEAEVLCAPPVSSDDISKQVEVTTNTLREKLVVRYWAGEDNSTLHTNTDLAHNWYVSKVLVATCYRQIDFVWSLYSIHVQTNKEINFRVLLFANV